MKLIPCPLKENAAKSAKLPAIIAGAVSLNYRELDRVVDASVKRLSDSGVKEGDRICVIRPVNIECLIVLFALWRLKAIACLLNYRNPEIMITEQCKTVKAKLVLRQREIKRLVDLSKKGVTPNFNGIDFYKIRCDPFFALDQPATVIFSSGSSGKPKAVQHSIGNHYYSAKGSNRNIPVGRNDRWLLSLPLYHVSGLSIIFRCLLGKAAIVIPDKKNDIREIIDKYKVTHISFVASQLYRLLGGKKSLKILKKVKAILLGGSAIPEALLKKAVKSGLPVYVSYGLTEMSSQVATTGLLRGNNFLSVPKILPYRKVSVHAGEILLSGKTLFQGYMNKGKIEPAVDAKGWFHSKDAGYKKGRFLYVKGRRDNMFISGGENIFPEEIEKILQNCRFIEQALVVPVRDKEYGYRPIAFIKAKGSKSLSRKFLLDYLKTRLPKFKIPDYFYSWPQKGLSAGIKLQREDFKSKKGLHLIL